MLTDYRGHLDERCLDGVAYHGTEMEASNEEISKKAKPVLVQLNLRNSGRFESVYIKLAPLTVIIGPNDSGKSTVLKALRCLTCDLELSPGDIRRDGTLGTGRASEVRIEAVVEDAPREIRERLRLQDSDPSVFGMTWTILGPNSNDYVLPKKPRFEMKSRIPLIADLRLWPKTKNEQAELLERLGINPGRNEAERREQWVVRRDEALKDPKGTMLDWQEVDKEYFLKYLLRIEAISDSDISNPESLLHKLLIVKARSIVYPEGEDGAKQRIESLKEIEESVEKSLNENLLSLTHVIEKHLPGLSSIRVRPRWDFVQGADFSDVILSRDGEAIPLGELGAGSSSRCALAMLEWATQMGDGGSMNARLRTMDEPDHGLHFDAQRRLISLLRRDVDDDSSSLAQCVVATHSLTMLDAVSLDHVVYIPEQLPKDAVLSPLLSKDESDACELLGDIHRGLGLPASWVFLEKAIIVVEGATELEYVKGLYNLANNGRTLVEDGVRVWDSQGCGNVSNTVKRLHEGGRAAVFVVLDSDAKSRHVSGEGDLTAEGLLNEVLKGEKVQPRIAWLGDKELEDEWRPMDLAKLADSNWPREDGRSWLASDFEEVAGSEKPSDMIVETIRRGARSRLSQRQKPRKEYIGRLMARLPSAQHPIQLLELLKAVSRSCNQ